MWIIGLMLCLCIAYYIFIYPFVWIIRETYRDYHKTKSEALYEDLDKLYMESIKPLEAYPWEIFKDPFYACHKIYFNARKMIEEKKYSECRRLIASDPFKKALLPYADILIPENRF